jgi:hypothetical protein
MKTIQHASIPVLSQTDNLPPFGSDLYKLTRTIIWPGKIFMAFRRISKRIRFYSSLMQRQDDMALTLHEFDPAGEPGTAYRRIVRVQKMKEAITLLTSAWHSRLRCELKVLKVGNS